MLYRILLYFHILFFSYSVHSSPLYQIQTEDFAPYAYELPNGEIDGMALDIIHWMLDDLAIDSPILMLPWARAIHNTRTKNWNVLFSVARTPEREDWFQWVGPFYSDEILLFRKKTIGTPPPSPTTIKQYGLVLVTRDYPEEKILTQQGYKNLAYTTNPSISLKMLLGNRADYLALGKAALPCLLAKEKINIETIESTGISIHSTELYIAMSKSTPTSEVQRWQNSLDKLKSSSMYEKFINETRHCQ
ncbi:substrate-binding periplasmic protein [Neptuniibacter sp. QD29_5]|uniref:substrate-binding periplasmic protein n=1 Tax=Neptuniibacter sp. QD29_5 TaxID=3398207 RepID=UPI0039F57F85